jgi:DeoR family fructose operon transcriptional repressor
MIATGKTPEGVPRENSASPRREPILAALRAAGFLTVADLVDQLGVSHMTVRRDLRRLHDLGEVRIVYGGASLPHGTLRTIGFVDRATRNADAKTRIAAAAAATIDDEDAISLDAGTTVYALAASLSPTFAGAVVTASVPVVQALLHREGLRLIGVGGQLDPDDQSFVGPMAVNFIRGMKVEAHFTSAGAIDAKGIYVASDAQREVKQALMAAANRVILLITHDKLAASVPLRVCGFDRIDTVITDQPLPAPVQRAVLRAGGSVIVAEHGDDGAAHAG